MPRRITTGEVLVAVNGKSVDGLGDTGLRRLFAGAPGTELELRLRSSAGELHAVRLRLAAPSR